MNRKRKNSKYSVDYVKNLEKYNKALENRLERCEKERSEYEEKLNAIKQIVFKTTPPRKKLGALYARWLNGAIIRILRR